jgi:hypothetical protein
MCAYPNPAYLDFLSSVKKSDLIFSLEPLSCYFLAEQRLFCGDRQRGTLQISSEKMARPGLGLKEEAVGGKAVGDSNWRRWIGRPTA